MKKFLLGLLMGIALSITQTAYQHSGGTDKCGGHYDHSTGLYHVHDWYKASTCGETKPAYDPDKQDKWKTYQPKQKVYEYEEKDETCYICDGKGYTLCSSCAGTGQVCNTCWGCTGKGYKLCTCRYR